MTDLNRQKWPYPLGANVESDTIRFSFVSNVSKETDCGILLFDRITGKRLDKIPFSQEDRIGNVYCKTIDDLDASRITYQFYIDDKAIPDRRARVFPGRTVYGREREWSDLKAGFLTQGFDWEGDCRPRIPYHQALIYCLHVRGFTKHSSSKVENRGTFAGIQEKIPYLKEIGVTTLELQPAYEFTEIPSKEELLVGFPYGTAPLDGHSETHRKLNYWGYKEGYYYAPKAVYAASEDPTVEFKELVRALHKNGMELVMQMYFPDGVNRCEIPEILRFWLLEYHVDGFHLMGDDIPADLLATDDILADTKLWYYHFNTDYIYSHRLGMDGIFSRREQPEFSNVAEYNDAWCCDMRRFLKGDEGMIGSALYHMRHIPWRAGCIHYLSNYSGFTLADMVSYDYKHNEANGEENRDGTDYNLSWNCGEEGTTKRKKVHELRLRQIKNAMSLIIFSHSTPLIFMGDEFGNSQKGNNNPYCQDNVTSWLDWNVCNKNREIFEFWKQLVSFRREHPILRPERELRLMDDLACGYPDLSYHGQNAWRPQTDVPFRHIGVLLCGKYARAKTGDDSFVYLAINMHWESHELALPRLPKGQAWKAYISTETVNELAKETSEGGEELTRRIPPRCIVAYISVPSKDYISESKKPAAVTGSE